MTMHFKIWYCQSVWDAVEDALVARRRHTEPWFPGYVAPYDA